MTQCKQCGIDLHFVLDGQICADCDHENELDDAEGRCAALRTDLAKANAEVEHLESFVEQFDAAGKLLSDFFGEKHDPYSCWGESAIDIADRVKELDVTLRAEQARTGMMGTEIDRLRADLERMKRVALYAAKTGVLVVDPDLLEEDIAPEENQ